MTIADYNMVLAYISVEYEKHPKQIGERFFGIKVSFF